jgi:catechol 2,3-dioxygenase-like lactoylglutathione lyase family enzyme
MIMQEPRLNAMGIVVADMDAAIAFYSRLRLKFEVDSGMPDHMSCDLPSGLHLMRQPWDAFWGMRYATVLDPDGNGIDLYCPLGTP